MVRNICILMTLVWALGCSEESADFKRPARPSNIPVDAFWKGQNGAAGHWFKIHYVHDHKNAAFISIYDAVKGERIASKKFHLICVGRNRFLIGELEQQIDRWEDNKIFLKSQDGKTNCYLL